MKPKFTVYERTDPPIAPDPNREKMRRAASYARRAMQVEREREAARVKLAAFLQWVTKKTPSDI
jgi:hypothetical protein